MENVIKRCWSFFEQVCYLILVKILRIKISLKAWEGLMQFIKFGIIGVSNTLISYVIYLVALVVFQKNNWFGEMDYLIAQILGFLLSVLWSFYWNRKYVFASDKEANPWFQALVKTYCSYAFTGIFLNTVLSILWVEKLGISKMLAPILNIFVSVPLNFVMNKFWAFKKQERKE